jgi:hypothetical protein
VPASRDGLTPFYQDVIAVDPLEPWGPTSAAYRLQMLARSRFHPLHRAGSDLVMTQRARKACRVAHAPQPPPDVTLPIP